MLYISAARVVAACPYSTKPGGRWFKKLYCVRFCAIHLPFSSLLAAAAQHDVDASKLEKGKWIAQNLTQYNFLNHLPPGLVEYGQAATTLAADMQSKGATGDEIAQAQLELARGQGFDGVQPATEFVEAWGRFLAFES